MPANTKPLNLVLPAVEATSFRDFFASVESGFMALKNSLESPETKKAAMVELKSVFAKEHGWVRQRRILELCAWPIFDKPMLPRELTDSPEFLWIFCVPFVVQFAESAIAAPFDIPAGSIDSLRILRAIQETKFLSVSENLSGFPSLLTREDIHKHGPQRIAAHFVGAEAGLDVEVATAPLSFDPAIESGRVVTLFMLAAARMPTGSSSLFDGQVPWDGTTLERHLLADLTQMGFPVESVQSSAPCPVAEALFNCSGAGATEIRKVLQLANKHYSSTEFVLRYPMPGMAELTAILEDGTEVMAIPPFHHLEPKEELQNCVQHLCEQQGFEFKGAFSAVLPAGLMIH